MFANSMSFDEKISYLYTIDLLLIVKLIEEHTEKRIDNSLYIKSVGYRENMTYEDYWELIELFMNESGLGTFNSFNEFCELQLNSFSYVHENIEQFSSEQTEDILEFFSLWEEKFTKKAYGRKYAVDEDLIKISSEPEDLFSWFEDCKQLIELDTFCKKQIEGLIK